MSPSEIIQVLLTIIGALIVGIIGLFVANINTNIRELKDMFIRHVRNDKIHVNMTPNN